MRRPAFPRHAAAATALALWLGAAAPSMAAAAPAESPQRELTLALAAKRLCSGLYVSGRQRDDVIGNSIRTFLDPAARQALESGALTFDVDDGRGLVTARHGEIRARARHFGDQGCVILRRDSDQPLFTPVTVRSTLPPADETPWPIGDAPPPNGDTAGALDARRLERALDVAFSEPADHTAAFLAVHRGRIVAERYGAGAGPDTQLESWSMGKSVTATLIGILIQQGRLRLEQPAPVPAWENVPGDPRAQIRLDQLLRMSSGLHCTSDADSAEHLQTSFVPGAPDHSLGYTTAIDVFQLAESRPLEHPPGTVGRYRNCDPLTLGAIIERIVEADGESYLRWPQQALFDRVGIRRQVLETDVYGNFVMTGFDFGTGRNWARLGLLYLNRGVFEGERILPESFVDFVSTPAPAWKDGEYGGLFWTGHDALPAGAYSMRGAGGQEVAIVPSHELVLVRLGHTEGATAGYEQRRNEAYRLIVEAVEEAQPDEPNRSAAPARAARDAAAAEVPRLEPSACVTKALTVLGATCYTFHGQENWRRPNGKLVRVPVAVIAPSSEPAADVPVFFFPGGPGYSTLDDRAYLEQLRKDIGARTLVTMDHRGFVHAEPALECPEYAAVSPYHNVIHTPALTADSDPMQRLDIITGAVSACYRDLEAAGVDVSQYNSWSVSRDVDEIRRLLGYRKIDAFGSSTGSGTVLSFIRYHPQSVRSAILGWPWFNHLRNRSPVDELGVAKQTFTDALALCVADDPACRALLPEWLRSIDRARRLLDETPYVVQVDPDGGTTTLRFDGAAFLHTLYLTLADTYAELPSIVAGIEAGDYSRLHDFFRVGDFHPTPQAPRYALGYFLAHVCNDMGRNRPTREDSLAAVRREPAVMGFEPPWLCAWWGEDGDVPAGHNDAPVSDTPALALHGQMDPCCGPRWSRHLQRTMPKVQHVVFQALGHNPVNDCRSTIIRAFLDRPHRPVDDGCRNEVPLEPWAIEDPRSAQAVSIGPGLVRPSNQ